MTRHSSKSGSKAALRPTSPGLPVSSSPPDFPHPTPPADPCQAEIVRPDSGKLDRSALRDETGATAQAPAAQTPTADPVPARSAVPAQAFATAPAAEALPAQTGALMRRAQAECRGADRHLPQTARRTERHPRDVRSPCKLPHGLRRTRRDVPHARPARRARCRLYLVARLASPGQPGPVSPRARVCGLQSAPLARPLAIPQHRGPRNRSNKNLLTAATDSP